MNTERAPSIAIFPWGDVVEEFLDPIGLSAADFAEEMTGGWLFGYVAALQSAGWRPIIVCASEGTRAPVRMLHKGTGAPLWMVPGKRVRQGRSPAAYSLRRWRATPLRAFREVLEREACRAIIVQEYEYTRFDQLVRLGIPTIASFQGGDVTLSWVEGLVRRRSIRKAAGLIVASSAERGRIARAHGATLPHVADIPNPIDTEEWRPIDRIEARRALGLSETAFIAINHGRIDIKRKGHDVLLKAWAAARGDELVIIGSGQDHDAFAALLAESGLANVRWLSSYTTDRPLLRRWLSAADIYITASRLEGMPVAPIEAMACRLPVIATDAQGLPDILADGEASGGLMVARDDVAGIASAIERLRTEPALRDRLAAAARHRIEDHFSIEAVGRSLATLLAGALPGVTPSL